MARLVAAGDLPMLKFEPKTADEEALWLSVLKEASPVQLTELLAHNRAMIDGLRVEQKQIEAEMERRLKLLRPAPRKSRKRK